MALNSTNLIYIVDKTISVTDQILIIHKKKHFALFNLIYRISKIFVVPLSLGLV